MAELTSVGLNGPASFGGYYIDAPGVHAVYLVAMLVGRRECGAKVKVGAQFSIKQLNK